MLSKGQSPPPIYEIIKSAAVDFTTRGGRKVYPRKTVPMMIHLSFLADLFILPINTTFTLIGSLLLPPRS